MQNTNLLQITPIKVIFSFVIVAILAFLLYEILHLEQRVEKNMLDISTSDVLSITKNNANSIKNLLKGSDSYIDEIKEDEFLQKQIENKLKLLITENIQYAYLLYKDEKNTFRFLADASKPEEKALLNQKFDVDSQHWFDIYAKKKTKIIYHEFLKTLSISLIVPILRDDSVELLLVIDFSLKKVENINGIITLMKNGIIAILLISILFLSVLLFQMFSYNKVKKSIFTDPLTNVYNRHYLEEYEDKIELEDYILAVIDIDFFKKVNDTYGHDAGDIVLKKTAEIISHTIRISNDDIVVRFGGEEFIVLIRKTDGNEQITASVLHRILINIQKFHFQINIKERINITVSIGVNLTPNKSSNFKEAFKLADNALYRAKENGRNNIQTA